MRPISNSTDAAPHLQEPTTVSVPEQRFCFFDAPTFEAQQDGVLFRRQQVPRETADLSSGRNETVTLGQHASVECEQQHVPAARDSAE